MAHSWKRAPPFNITNNTASGLNRCQKRHGIPLNLEAPAIQELKKALLEDGIMEGRSFAEPTGLLRLAGCKAQMWHFDFPSYDAAMETPPCTVFLSLEDHNEVCTCALASYNLRPPSPTSLSSHPLSFPRSWTSAVRTRAW